MSDQYQQQNEGQIPGAVSIPDDAPPAPVDVDLDSGEVAEAKDTPAPRQEQEQQKKQPLPRPQARIQALAQERDMERDARMRLENELAEARRLASEKDSALALAERTGMENMVARVKAEVIAAKAALKAAKDAEDDDAEVEAQARLARAAAEEADAEAWLAANPKQQQQEPRQPQQRQEQQQQQRQEFAAVSPPVRDFMADNPWFSAVQIGNDGRPVVDRSTGRMVSNPDYDEDLHDIAMLEHKRIEREVRRGALDKRFIESPEYFQRISDAVRAAAPDAFEEAEEVQPARRAPQMDAGKQPVAPSSRQVPGAAPKAGTKMRLDGEQAALVRSLVDNGTMIYPRNHPDPAKRGMRMSYEDAYLDYARKAKADAASRNQ